MQLPLGVDQRQRKPGDLRRLASLGVSEPGEGACSLERDPLLYVGFSQDYIDSWGQGRGAEPCGDGPERDRSLFVPTPAAWFEALQRKFDLAIPLGTQKAMTLGLGLQPYRSTTYR